MIGHHARFRENDDLPLWRGPAAKKKPPFYNAPALITRKIMRSRDAQCNSGNNLKRHDAVTKPEHFFVEFTLLFHLSKKYR